MSGARISDGTGVANVATGVRNVQTELNAAASQATSPAMTEGASAPSLAPPAAPETGTSRQAPLPGFDKI